MSSTDVLHAQYSTLECRATPAFVASFIEKCEARMSGRRRDRVLFSLYCLLTALPAAGQALPVPIRPLPQPSQRPLPTGHIIHVDATRGDDAADGSREKPLLTLARAIERVKPGQTICLRGGIYYERVTVR